LLPIPPSLHVPDNNQAIPFFPSRHNILCMMSYSSCNSCLVTVLIITCLGNFVANDTRI
jgi:hypothetical protein